MILKGEIKQKGIAILAHAIKACGLSAVSGVLNLDVKCRCAVNCTP